MFVPRCFLQILIELKLVLVLPYSVFAFHARLESAVVAKHTLKCLTKRGISHLFLQADRNCWIKKNAMLCFGLKRTLPKSCETITLKRTFVLSAFFFAAFPHSSEMVDSTFIIDSA